jgi:hypothetical protein
MKPLLAATAGTFALILTGDTAQAIETIEAVGAERCGGSVKAFEVEFLAPDTASMAGEAKAIVNGLAASPLPHACQSMGGSARVDAVRSRPRKGRPTGSQLHRSCPGREPVCGRGAPLTSMRPDLKHSDEAAIVSPV